MLKNYTKVEENHHGTKRYYNDKEQLHRLDGPAVEFKDGTKYWYINGNNHRNIDPSNQWQYRIKYWCFKDKAHRIGGPCSSAFSWWFIHGKEYSKEGYYNKVWDI